MTVREYFEEDESSIAIFERLRECVETLGPVEIKVTKSQVAFCRRRAFAYAWKPRKYLQGRGVPLVLTIPLRRRDNSRRWKEVVHPSPKWFIHHLEVNGLTEIEGEVLGWLARALEERNQGG